MPKVTIIVDDINWEQYDDLLEALKQIKIGVKSKKKYVKPEVKSLQPSEEPDIFIKEFPKEDGYYLCKAPDHPEPEVVYVDGTKLIHCRNEIECDKYAYKDYLFGRKISCPDIQ